MSVTVRFAPSPTGSLHVGNARTALFNWFYAKRHGGRFILRYDDTDRQRSTEAFADQILADLRWLGIEPDAIVWQSARFPRYDEAASKLRAAHRLYPCYETEEELEYRRKRQLAMGRPPIYDRVALRLSEAERARLEGEGRRPYWRFLLEARSVSFHDLVRGPQTIDCSSLSDPVLVRADGSYLYTLPSVVDDIELGVTHVIRGEDHVTNTGVQIQLFEALGAKAPVFAHHNLLTLASGEALSKRLGHLSLSSLREAGFEPLAVAALATLVGTAHALEPIGALTDLGSGFDFSQVSHSAARFDPSELELLNARTLHRLPFSAVQARLSGMGVGGGEAFWEAVKPNLSKLAEAQDWWGVVTGPLDPAVAPAEPDLLARAVATLPNEPWDADTWRGWTESIRAATGRKGRELYRPLRIALTGREHGPELKTLLPLLGRERVLARLQGKAA